MRARLRERVRAEVPKFELPALDLEGLTDGIETDLDRNLAGARDRIESTFDARLSADQRALLDTLPERTTLYDAAGFDVAHAAYSKKLGVDRDPDAIAFVDGDRVHTSRDDAHTLTHEAIHLVADDDFTKFFGAAINEGVTEYLTARALEGDAAGRAELSSAFVARKAAYPDEVATIEGAIERGFVDRDLVERAFFTGDQVARAKLFVGLERAGVKMDGQVAKDPAMADVVRTLGR